MGLQPIARKPRQIAKFCSSCGGKIELAIPEDETEWRHVCTECQTITYYNPKMVCDASFSAQKHRFFKISMKIMQAHIIASFGKFKSLSLCMSEGFHGPQQMVA